MRPITPAGRNGFRRAFLATVVCALFVSTAPSGEARSAPDSLEQAYAGLSLNIKRSADRLQKRRQITRQARIKVAATQRSLYTTSFHPAGFSGTPWFRIRGNQLYTTSFHPAGFSGTPWFQIRGNQLYTTSFHPSGYTGTPWFQVRGNQLYTTSFHPAGYTGSPWFRIR
ncbi:hypothetical protein ACFL2T_06035 [Elusimicrobiota bacterium]